jgi:hypothetical protein
MREGAEIFRAGPPGDFALLRERISPDSVTESQFVRFSKFLKRMFSDANSRNLRALQRAIADLSHSDRISVSNALQKVRVVQTNGEINQRDSDRNVFVW